MMILPGDIESDYILTPNILCVCFCSGATCIANVRPLISDYLQWMEVKPMGKPDEITRTLVETAKNRAAVPILAIWEAFWTPEGKALAEELRGIEALKGLPIYLVRKDCLDKCDMAECARSASGELLTGMFNEKCLGVKIPLVLNALAHRHAALTD